MFLLPTTLQIGCAKIEGLRGIRNRYRELCRTFPHECPYKCITFILTLGVRVTKHKQSNDQVFESFHRGNCSNLPEQQYTVSINTEQQR